jgi:hypothetical protein
MWHRYYPSSCNVLPTFRRIKLRRAEILLVLAVPFQSCFPLLSPFFVLVQHGGLLSKRVLFSQNFVTKSEHNSIGD